MRHSKIKKLISIYLDGELIEKERKFIESHIRECESCSKEYLEFLELQNLFKEKQRKVILEDDLIFNLYKKIEETLKQKSSLIEKLGTLSFKILPLPTVIVVLLIFFTIFKLSNYNNIDYLDKFFLEENFNKELLIELNNIGDF